MKHEKNPPPAPPASSKPKPVVVAFALVKKDARYRALAFRIQGHEVLEEKILEDDDFRDVAESAVDRATHEFWRYGVDPFTPEEIT